MDESTEHRAGDTPFVLEHEVDGGAEAGAGLAVGAVHQHTLADVQSFLDEGVQVIQHAVAVVKDYTIASFGPKKR